jgi:hypothetical protein
MGSYLHRACRSACPEHSRGVNPACGEPAESIKKILFFLVNFPRSRHYIYRSTATVRPYGLCRGGPMARPLGYKKEAKT